MTVIDRLEEVVMAAVAATAFVTVGKMTTTADNRMARVTERREGGG